jgi:beta-lactamase regulating signal transducer with metallopeptidase domain
VECIPLLLASNAACAAGLAVVVALLAAFVQRPAFANRAWLVVLLKLVAPPLVAVPLVWHAAARETISVPQSEEPLPAIVAPPIELPDMEAIEPEPAAAALPDAAALVVVSPDPPAGVPSESAEAVPVWRWLGFAWLAGALGYWALVAVRVVRFRRVLRDAEPVPGGALPAALAAQVGLRRLPVIAFVPWDISPMVWAVFGRPRVLLPRRLWAALSPEQREAVLAHELAHLARGDHWVRRLELLVLGAYWWFPVAWLAVRELRRAEEACCDAWAVRAAPGRAGAYAEALVEAVAFVSRPGRVPLASGGAARVSQLKRRLTMILRNPPSPRLRWPAALAVAALAVAALPWSPTLADDTPRDPPQPPTRTAQPLPTRDPVRVVEAIPVGKPVRVVQVDQPFAVHFTSESANQLKDELELLVAQRETKQAMVRAAEAALKTATVKLANTTHLAGQNVVSQQEVDLYRNAAASAEAQLAVRKGELKEQDVKIAQAKRRLERATTARLVRPTETRQTRPDPPRLTDTETTTVSEISKRIQTQMEAIARQQQQLVERRQRAQITLESLKVEEAALKDQMTKLQAAQQKIRDALKAKGPDLRKP